jgi:hypothetical protein
MTEQNFRALLCRWTEFACDAHRSYLNEYSLVDELLDSCGMILDVPIAFRMDKNRTDAFQL